MSETDERYTPQGVLDVVRALAPIGLDPCTVEANPTGARFFYTMQEDGCAASWGLCPAGELVYVNPPYSRGSLPRFARKVEDSLYLVGLGREIVVLTPCDLGTSWATTLFKHADALAGWRGRIAFVTPDGDYGQGAKQPSVVWYFGDRAKRFAAVFGAHANVTRLGGQ